jgi:Tfp pilus assembly protein PilF
MAADSIGFRSDSPDPPPKAPPAAPAAPPLVHAWSVPYARNVHFTGREDELADLNRSLTSDQASRRVQVICGLGGVGKTQLALEYLYRNRDSYNVVWWINADEPATLALGYAKLASQLGMRIPEGISLDDIRHALRRLLDTRNDYLLVFDNVSSPEDIKNYLPIERKGHVLITSRNPNWDQIARTLALRPMKRVDSVQFLLHRTGVSKPDTAVGLLAQALGDLPLAMEQAAACIERTRMDFSGYLKRFETHWAELLGESRNRSEYPDSVEMTWAISFRQLQEESPEAGELLNLLSFLGPDAIPRSLLQSGAAVLPEGIALVVVDDLRLNAAIESLRTFSLVEDDGRLISIHRLVGALVRDRLHETEREMWAEAAIKMVAQGFKFETMDLASWERCAELLPHALAAAWHAEANRIAPRATIQVLDDAGRYLTKRAQFTEAKSLFERAMALATTFYGPTHPQVSSIANNLGRVQRELGNLDEAKHLFEQSMSIDQQVYGQEDPRLGAVFNNYGVILQEQGDSEGARQQFEWALMMYQTHFGPDHPKVAAIINNLGYVLNSTGDMAAGKEHFQKALELARESYGDQHPTVGMILINLAMVQRLSGDLSAARGNLERALDICESVNGPSHPTVARACGHLGAVLQDLKLPAAARGYFERALQVDEAFFGPKHANVAGRAVQLAQLLRQLGDKDGAQALVDRANAILSSASELKPPASSPRLTAPASG